MVNQTAQGLASLGRNGDTMLVHMSPEEVGGLKQVGDSLGIRMSTNPHTGMPEAFSFGDFFTSFLPTIVGAAVGGPAGGGLMSSMSPILAGAGTGALLAAAKGDDPLMGTIMGGMGGYGGAGLGSTFSKAFGPASSTTAESFGKLASQGAQQVMGGGVGNIGAFSNFKDVISPVASATPKAVTSLSNQISPFTNTTLGTNLGVQNVNPTVGVNAGGYDAAAAAAAELNKPPQFMSNLSDLGTGVKNLTGLNPNMSISDAYKKFTDAGGTAMDLAMPVGGGVLAGLEPSDLGYGGGDLYDDPDKGKYRGPMGQLNLSDKYDTGLRLVAKGGYINGYALGGAVNPNPPEGGGISDLYNRPEGQISAPLSMDNYGVGRLSSLANQQSLEEAKTLGYAMGGLTALKSGGQPGGYLNGDGDGMSDSIPATIDGKQPARLADGEFVIPADVVSHLGNGSSKAGSKRLYAMLDKVRTARTGTKKQGKQIKADKYLPA